MRKHFVLLMTGAALALLPMGAASAADSKPHLDTSGANMQPAYPATAIKGQEAGAVQVTAHVETNGTVSEVRLNKSSGFDDLDSAAMNAVHGWKFVPAVQNGSPTDGWTTVQLQFQPPPPQ